MGVFSLKMSIFSPKMGVFGCFYVFFTLFFSQVVTWRGCQIQRRNCGPSALRNKSYIIKGDIPHMSRCPEDFGVFIVFPNVMGMENKINL
jgi:hypothetical protein